MACLLLTSGYLPAEHIETPTERLARLNKHRNIDVRDDYFFLRSALIVIAHIYYAG